MSTLDESNNFIDPKEVSAWPTGGRYGLLAGLVLIAIGLVMHLSGMVDYTGQSGSSNWIANILNWGVIVGAIVLAVKKHRDEELGGFITFGRSFNVGFIVALVIAVISMVWGYLFFAFIEPDLIETIMEASKEQMIEQQGMSEAQADQSFAMMSWMFNPLMMSLFGGLGSLIAGIIFSLIVGAFMKNPHPAQQA